MFFNRSSSFTLFTCFEGPFAPIRLNRVFCVPCLLQLDFTFNFLNDVSDPGWFHFLECLQVVGGFGFRLLGLLSRINAAKGSLARQNSFTISSVYRNDYTLISFSDVSDSDWFSRSAPIS